MKPNCPELDSRASGLRCQLVFVVGAPRSGTTWLQLMLSQSPQVTTAQETHLFSLYLRSMFESWDKMKKDNRGTGLSGLVSEDEYLRWIERFCEYCLYRMVKSGSDGVSVLLEKTPAHGTYAGDILRIFPGAYFIHVIRDPRAVVSSLRAASRTWGGRWAPENVFDACAMWKTRVNNARAIRDLTDRYHEVSYEQLHADAPGRLMEISAWLGVDIDRVSAKEYVNACAIDKLQSGCATAPWDLKDEPKSFYRYGKPDSWRTDLSPSDIALVERLTRKQMAELGYEPVSGRRARIAASSRLRVYKSAVRLEKVAHGLTERMKP